MIYSDKMFPTMFDYGVYLFGHRFVKRSQNELMVKINNGDWEQIKEYYKGEIKEIEIKGKK